MEVEITVTVGESSKGKMEEIIPKYTDRDTHTEKQEVGVNNQNSNMDLINMFRIMMEEQMSKQIKEIREWRREMEIKHSGYEHVLKASIEEKGPVVQEHRTQNHNEAKGLHSDSNTQSVFKNVNNAMENDIDRNDTGMQDEVHQNEIKSNNIIDNLKCVNNRNIFSQNVDELNNTVNTSKIICDKGKAVNITKQYRNYYKNQDFIGQGYKNNESQNTDNTFQNGSQGKRHFNSNSDSTYNKYEFKERDLSNMVDNTQFNSNQINCSRMHFNINNDVFKTGTDYDSINIKLQDQKSLNNNHPQSGSFGKYRRVSYSLNHIEKLDCKTPRNNNKIKEINTESNWEKLKFQNELPNQWKEKLSYEYNTHFARKRDVNMYYQKGSDMEKFDSDNHVFWPHQRSNHKISQHKWFSYQRNNNNEKMHNLNLVNERENWRDGLLRSKLHNKDPTNNNTTIHENSIRTPSSQFYKHNNRIPFVDRPPNSGNQDAQLDHYIDPGPSWEATS